MADPNNGPAHGRFRQTIKNTYGDTRRADPFPLGPSDQSALGMARRDLFFNNKIAMASLRQQAQMVKSQYRYAKRNAVAEGRAGISAVAGDAAERGMLGSTVQAVGQENVRAGVQGAIGDEFMNRQAALMEVNQSRLQAVAQLRMGLSDLAMKRAAAQREMALGAFGSGGQNPYGY